MPQVDFVTIYIMALKNITTAVISWLIVTTIVLPCIILFPHHQQIFSKPIVITLLFFNNLNILIALCEIALGKHITTVKSDYVILCQKYQHTHKEFDACLAFLSMPLPCLFDGRAWSRMWSTYALYDPSYQNHESFGFFIDFGNGLSTIPPSLLLNYALILPQGSHYLSIGCIGICMYWQIMYGTLVYLLSFVYNKRYRGKGLLEVLAFVGISNSMWIIFPALGMYACFCMLRDRDMSIFQ